MALGLFLIATGRWKATKFIYGQYHYYSMLEPYITEEDFKTHMHTVEALVAKEYPRSYYNAILVTTSALFIVAAAIFAVIAHTLSLPLWYPLLLLIGPVIIGIGISRERRMYFERMTHFHECLRICLGEISACDRTRRLRWRSRRLKEEDNVDDLCFSEKTTRWNVTVIIEVLYVNHELELDQGLGDALPLYGSTSDDVVLAMGPEIHPSERETDIDTPPDYCDDGTHYPYLVDRYEMEDISYLAQHPPTYPPPSPETPLPDRRSESSLLQHTVPFEVPLIAPPPPPPPPHPDRPSDTNV